MEEDIRDLFAKHEKKDLDRFNAMDGAMGDMDEKLNLISTDVKRVIEIYEGMNFMGRFLIKGGAYSAAVGAIIFLIYQIKHFFTGK